MGDWELKCLRPTAPSVQTFKRVRGAAHPDQPSIALTRCPTPTADHEEQPAEEDTTAFFSEADEVLRLIGSFSDPTAAHEAAA